MELLVGDRALNIMDGRADHNLNWLAFLLLWLAYRLQVKENRRCLVPNTNREHMSRTVARIEFQQVLQYWSRT